MTETIDEFLMFLYVDANRYDIPSSGVRVLITPENVEQVLEWKANSEKLGDLSIYPDNKFGHMSVLDYLDLVELQTEHYTKRALDAEKRLREIDDKSAKWDEVYDFLKISEADIVVGVLKRELRDSKKLEAVKKWFFKHGDFIDPDYSESDAREELRMILDV